MFEICTISQEREKSFPYENHILLTIIFLHLHCEYDDIDIIMRSLDEMILA